MSELPLPVGAFVAGFVSFLSPCVLPLVPGYVSLISGATVEELSRRQDVRLRRIVLINSVMFVVGFSVVFVSMGAVATSIGQLLQGYRTFLSIAAGLIIILFGLHLTGLLPIKAFYAEKRLQKVGSGASVIGSFLIGFAFAFGWTPCIGPILATILAFASVQETVAKGVGLLALYSGGLAVPFLLTSIGIAGFLQFYGRFRSHLHKVEVGSGALLILIGGLILFDKFTVLNGYLAFLNRFAL